MIGRNWAFGGVGLLLGVVLTLGTRGAGGVPLRIVHPDKPAEVLVRVTIEKAEPALPFVRPRGDQAAAVGCPCGCPAPCPCACCPAKDGAAGGVNAVKNFGLDTDRLDRERTLYGPGFVK